MPGQISPLTQFEKERLTGFSLEGHNEVRIIIQKLEHMIIGESHMVTGKTRKIFNKKPGLCWDKYFSGDNFFDHIGKNGYGMLSTAIRDCIPKLVQEKAQNGTEPWNVVAKCSTFNETIVMVQKKKFRDKEYIQ